MEQIKTVAYLRYGNSANDNVVELVERDKKLYAEICKKNGMVLVDTYFDQGCSRGEERKGFLQMMDDSTTGMFQRVIVKHLSKLDRITMESLNIIRQLKENDVLVWSISDGGLVDENIRKVLQKIAEEELEKGIVFPPKK